MRPLLTVREVADLLRLHKNTVDRMLLRGELPYFRVTPRGDKRLRPEDIEAFLAERRT